MRSWLRVQLTKGIPDSQENLVWNPLLKRNLSTKILPRFHIVPFSNPKRELATSKINSKYLFPAGVHGVHGAQSVYIVATSRHFEQRFRSVPTTEMYKITINIFCRKKTRENFEKHKSDKFLNFCEYEKIMMAWIFTDLQMDQTRSSSLTISSCYESEKEKPAVGGCHRRLFYGPAAAEG